jgi:DNA repair protein RAD50
LTNFDTHIAQQKQKKRKEESVRQDKEDELANVRKQHVNLVNEQGELAAEAKVSIAVAKMIKNQLTMRQAQEQRISDRSALIQEISSKHGIKGYDNMTIDKKVSEFISRLDEVQRKQKKEFDKIQVQLDA